MMSFEEYAEEYVRQQSGIRRGADFLRGLVSRPPALFSGLMPDRSLTMISAEPGCGKTMLTLAMCLSLDSGLPLMGKFTPRERKHCFFLGQDAPDWDYAEQFRKLARGYGIMRADCDNTDVDFRVNLGGTFVDRSFLGDLQRWHETNPYHLIIFDTLAAFHDLDERDPRQMGAVMAILKRLRDQFGCSVIFTHHSRKPTGDVPISDNYSARGSTVIPGAIDFHLHLRRARGELIRMSLAKGRGSEKLAPDAGFKILEGDTPEGPWVRLEYRELSRDPQHQSSQALSRMSHQSNVSLPPTEGSQ